MTEFEKELEALFEEDWIAQEIIAKEELDKWEKEIYRREIR